MRPSSENEARQLLTYAAIAGGLKVVGWRRDSDAVSGTVEVALLDSGEFWQPLYRNQATDCMGDALRLAVHLKLDINGQSSPDHSRAAWGELAAIELDRGDAEAATCLAIVRIAAAIGKTADKGEAPRHP